MISLLAVALVASNPALAQACQAVSEVPDAMQVAWVSPVAARVGASAELEVVRVADLRRWIRDEGTDVGRLLQGLGLAPRNVERKAALGWKVTLFDVQTSWLCRPIDGRAGGEDELGVLTCDEKDAGKLRAHRYGYSGCGYTLDTGASSRGLEVYRVDWGAASAYGFCVMPLERFLGGA